MPKQKIAFIIGNTGLGDSIVLSGMVNYLASTYDIVYVACIIEFYEQLKLFYPNPKIIIYPINSLYPSHMYDFSAIMWEFRYIYDLYYIGNYGAIKIDNSNYTKTLRDGTVKKIITNYPTSYYDDVGIPIECMTKYFSVSYPQEIIDNYEDLLCNYPKYRILHQIGSNASVDALTQRSIDINDMLTIDVNKNLYPKGHKFHEICEKFVNLKSVIYYARLLENASELYLIDSCIHALALVVDVNKASPRICFQRESRFEYGIPNKFKYCQLVFYMEGEKIYKE